jgi:hypothetical protein
MIGACVPALGLPPPVYGNSWDHPWHGKKKVSANRRLTKQRTFLVFITITPPFNKNIKLKGGNIKEGPNPADG